jgi:hypothetical protein
VDQKTEDVTRSKWHVKDDAWKLFSINLQPLEERADSFEISRDVYRYKGLSKGTLIVDFANKHVGGAWDRGGYVQEEQMVAQSTDFAVCLAEEREWLKSNEVATYEGVHIDVWWPRRIASQGLKMSTEDIQPELSSPLVVIAVDAPDLKRTFRQYDLNVLEFLARKVYMCFAIQDQLDCPLMYSGLLGGGDFRGNRPLVLLLHLLLHNGERKVLFHTPIFSKEWLEPEVATRAEEMLERLRRKRVCTLEEALQEIQQWHLPLSSHDADLREPSSSIFEQVGRKQPEKGSKSGRTSWGCSRRQHPKTGRK